MAPDAGSLDVLSFRVILDEALKLWRRSIRSVIAGVGLPLLAGVLITFVFQLPWIRTMQQMQFDPQVMDGFSFARTMGVTFGLSMVYAALHTLAACVMMSTATDAATGQVLRVGRRWMWVFRPRVLGTTVILSVMIMSGMLCCLLPGILLGVVLGLTIPVMAVEGRYWIAAMQRSWDLIMYNPRGRFATHPGARLFAIGFCGLLLSYAATWAVQAPFAIAQQVMFFRSMAAADGAADTPLPDAWVWLQLPQVVLGTLATIAVTYYLCLAVALFFDDLRRRREGEDLDSALDSVGAPRTGI